MEFGVLKLGSALEAGIRQERGMEVGRGGPEWQSGRLREGAATAAGSVQHDSQPCTCCSPLYCPTLRGSAVYQQQFKWPRMNSGSGMFGRSLGSFGGSPSIRLGARASHRAERSAGLLDDHVRAAGGGKHSLGPSITTRAWRAAQLKNRSSLYCRRTPGPSSGRLTSAR